MKAIIRRAVAALPERTRASLMHLGFNVAKDEFKKFAFLGCLYICKLALGLPETVYEVNNYFYYFYKTWPVRDSSSIMINKSSVFVK